MYRRLPQVVLMASTVIGSWLGMQAVHETGHVLGAWLTGGRVERVVLHPLTVSRTDLAVNPHPGVVAWAGPVAGVLVPLLLWAVAARLRVPGAFVLRFFAGFCLVANGCYIGCGVLVPVGDAADMLVEWPARWPLGLFGVTTIIPGLALWNGLGERFGLGKSRGQVDRRHAILAAIVLISIIATEIVLPLVPKLPFGNALT